MVDENTTLIDSDSQKILDNCTTIQMMIDIYTVRLEGLRTQCSTSAELIQQEIRTLEGKLIKLFSRQIVSKSKLRSENAIVALKHIPSLEQWLQVVGLSESAIRSICSFAKNMETLYDMPDYELTKVLKECNFQPEEYRRLNKAMINLKKCIEFLSKGDLSKENDIILYWDSWDCQNLMKTTKTRLRPVRSSIPSDSFVLSSLDPINKNYQTPNIENLKDSKVSTVAAFQAINNNHHINNGIFNIKEKTNLNDTKINSAVTHFPKSQSHDSQLKFKYPSNNSIDNSNNSSSNEMKKVTNQFKSDVKISRNRLKTEPNLDVNYDNNSDVDHNSIILQVPKSPTFPHNVDNMIAHRFTKTFKMMSTCDFCDKQMFIGTGLKCKECKYKCHKECESKVPSSCGIPEELVNKIQKALPDCTFLSSVSPSFISSLKNRKTFQAHTTSSFLGLDSSSNTSSCNSSTPSSPAILTTPITTSKQHFNFPNNNNNNLNENLNLFENHQFKKQASISELTETCQSNDSDKTISGNSYDSDKTQIRVGSQDSQVSDSDIAVDSDKWPRQNSLSMKEWDIPFDELKLGECIGVGRFATVYRGSWHGDVAVKIFNVEYLGDEKTLETFRHEVGTFRKTRHENLILFMGACMKLPHLAIVTSLNKGMTLFTHIHLRRDKFNMNKITTIAQQICQGMGYLHSKNIIHKDLKSKNVFLDNGKVVITDFGLFSVTKLCNENKQDCRLKIPIGWLCYLAPEIVQNLTVQSKNTSELRFTKASDVFAFGTVWYELLCGEWPFKDQSPETVIWQIGRGMKQSLANLQTSHDVKDILMLCWSFKPSDRPDFAHELLELFKKLPKKRLVRSPSHPIYLSRSAESVF